MVGQGAGDDPSLAQKRSDRFTFALECRNQLAAQRIDLVGIQRPKQRTKSTQQCVEIQGGLGAVDGNGASRGQTLRVAGTFQQGQIAVTDRVGPSDRGLAGVGEHHRGVGGELHDRDVVFVHRDLLHLADLDPGNPHEITDGQAVDVGELGAVALFGLEAQLREDRGKRECAQQADHHKSREADDGAAQVAFHGCLSG